MTGISSVSQNSNVIKRAVIGDCREIWLWRLGLNEAFASAIYQHGIASSHEHIIVDSGGFH